MVCASQVITARVSGVRAASEGSCERSLVAFARTNRVLDPNQMCPACKSDRATMTSTRGTRDVAGVAFSAMLPAWLCTDCRHVVVDEHVSRAFDRGIAVDVAQRGPTNGETFRFLRARLALSSEELAAILEVDPTVLRRWENGAPNVERLAWLVVAGLVLESIDASVSTSVRIPGASATTRTEAEIRLPWDRERNRAAG
jgi:DNA-binding transcriptional regulator YiaG